jgi:hypothetical protein
VPGQNASFMIGLSAMPFYVYVIELDQGVLQSRRFRERNPDMNPDGRCFYVGQSAHEPKCRFEQHKQCYGASIEFHCSCSTGPVTITKNLSNSFVRNYGKWIRWRLFQAKNPVETREEAEQIEERIAIDLQQHGHGVWWN